MEEDLHTREEKDFARKKERLRWWEGGERARRKETERRFYSEGK